MSGIKIKIYPKGLGTKVYRVLAITEDITFRELCDYIGYTFNLDYFSHMYEFVLGKPGRFTECVSMQEFDHNMFEFSIPKTIYFHYDFGRDLYFVITIKPAVQRSDNVIAIQQRRFICNSAILPVHQSLVPAA